MATGDAVSFDSHSRYARRAQIRECAGAVEAGAPQNAPELWETSEGLPTSINTSPRGPRSNPNGAIPLAGARARVQCFQTRRSRVSQSMSRVERSHPSAQGPYQVAPARTHGAFAPTLNNLKTPGVGAVCFWCGHQYRIGEYSGETESKYLLLCPESLQGGKLRMQKRNDAGLRPAPKVGHRLSRRRHALD